MAAKREFSSVPLGAAKISRIIRYADIPRGSFYQYFDTLDDLLQALWLDIEKHKNTHFTSLLQQARSDVIIFAQLVFTSEYQFFSDSSSQILLTNLLTIRSANREPGVFPIPAMADPPPQMLRMLPDDYQRLDPGQLYSLLNLIIACIEGNLRRSIAAGLSLDQAQKEFNSQLKIIQRGIFPDQEKR